MAAAAPVANKGAAIVYPTPPDMKQRDKEFNKEMASGPEWMQTAMNGFPRFDSNGNFPYPEFPLNILQQPIMQKFGPNTKPLLGRSPGFALMQPYDNQNYMNELMPSHLFESPSIYWYKNTMFVLPAMYYVTNSINPNKRMAAVGPELTSFQSGNNTWHIHEIRSGYFFYNQLVFKLAGGFIGTPTSPRQLDLMIAYAHYACNFENDPLSALNSEFKKFGNEEEEWLEQPGYTGYNYPDMKDNVMREPDISYLLNWHSELLNSHYYQLLSFYANNVVPLLNVFIGNLGFPLPPARHAEGLEIFFWRLYLAKHKFYCGPAAPYFEMKRDGSEPCAQMSLAETIKFKFEQRYREDTEDDPIFGSDKTLDGSDTVPREFVSRLLDPKTHEMLPEYQNPRQYGFYTPTPTHMSPLALGPAEGENLDDTLTNQNEQDQAGPPSKILKVDITINLGP